MLDVAHSHEAPRGSDDVSDAAARRMAAVGRYEIRDVPPDAAFDRITALAARLLHTPIAVIRIVDHERIWCTTPAGFDVDALAHDPGLCASAIRSDGPWVVEDAATDPRAKDNPLVTGECAVRFYAGVPLRTDTGESLGTLCVMGHAPRGLTPDEQATLEDLAAIAMAQLEMQLANRRLAADAGAHVTTLAQLAFADPLTGLSNRRALRAHFEHLLEERATYPRELSIVVCDLDHFKGFNDSYGHVVGDRALQATAGVLLAGVGASDAVGRIGGEEFLVLLDGRGTDGAVAWAERKRRRLKDAVVVGTDRTLTASFGVATYDGRESLREFFGRADAAVYRAKRAGRDRVERAEPAAAAATPSAEPPEVAEPV